MYINRYTVVVLGITVATGVAIFGLIWAVSRKLDNPRTFYGVPDVEGRSTLSHFLIPITQVKTLTLST